ncbi:hypothetical protein FHS83_000036 [Rhizomicrobium palustre]|uniref:Uncharacterized protein n=1 Tax=Rhizomicrobium palustre TaxID=189966 RepID=A0A846MT92_9PROT|nr:hypothetical protein [Rhizomicrobium palustre]NIK86718.1 hypothetical protein [Rhizomicrobium palustre]
MSEFWATLGSWFQFFGHTVLPVAARELLRWLYDWQILISGILALVAARLWGRAVIRAARINARAREGKRPSLEVVASRTITPAVHEPLPQQLHALRECIRNTLGRMPCTDETLSPERIADCRKIAEFPFPDLPHADKLFLHRYEALRGKLAALKSVRDSDTCRNAWEALVKISMDARDLLGEEVSAASR